MAVVKRAREELVFTLDFIFGTRLLSLTQGKSRDKLFRQHEESLPKIYSGNMLCSATTLGDERNQCFFFFFPYSQNFCVFRECGPSKSSSISCGCCYQCLLDYLATGWQQARLFNLQLPTDPAGMLRHEYKKTNGSLTDTWRRSCRPGGYVSLDLSAPCPDTLCSCF